eukprot:COSAG02_NODE_34037_length_490_cov_1.176471_1_plen_93_part_10
MMHDTYAASATARIKSLAALLARQAVRLRTRFACAVIIETAQLHNVALFSRGSVCERQQTSSTCTRAAGRRVDEWRAGTDATARGRRRPARAG